MNSKQNLADRLHDDLHRIPAMPPHDHAAVLNSHAHAPHEPHATRRPSLQNSGARHNDPKVLVSWQRFIGRLFGRD